MTRVARLDPVLWSDELREAIDPDHLTPLEQGPMRIHAQSPAIALAMTHFSHALRTANLLSDRLMELMRLQIAFHNQCRSCMAIRYSRAVDEGVDEGAVCSLERPMEAGDLSAAEKVAIRYGELLATDHLAIDDTVYDGLRVYFSERQLVELGQWAAFCVGFGRLAASWDMIEELPAAYQARDRPIAPWQADHIRIAQPPRDAEVADQRGQVASVSG